MGHFLAAVSFRLRPPFPPSTTLIYGARTKSAHADSLYPLKHFILDSLGGGGGANKTKRFVNAKKCHAVGLFTSRLANVAKNYQLVGSVEGAGRILKGGALDGPWYILTPS